jgi:hypothetical protein
VFISVFARRLKPGKTYEDFIAAWYPEKGFDVPTRGPFVARNIVDDREVLVIGFIDLPDQASLDAAMARLAKQELARHERIAEVIESTALRGIYEVSDEFDFSTDATAAAGRPVRQSGGY